jgi:plasmid stabilization system protein ParE
VKRLPIETTPEAEAQFLAIESWWRENRPRAPDLLFQEFVFALDMIESFPESGKVYLNSDPPVRRLLMRATRHHVYYQIRRDRILVLSVWGAVRGTGPPLDQ